jgi:hypothetical protein
MNYTQVAQMHFSKDVSAFQNAVLNTHGHWVVVHVRPQVQIFVLELVDDFGGVFCYFFVHAQEALREELPRKDVALWHWRVCLIDSFTRELRIRHTSNAEFNLINLHVLFNIFIFGFDPSLQKHFLRLAKTNNTSLRIIVFFRDVIKRFVFKKRQNEVPRNDADEIVVLIHNGKCSVVRFQRFFNILH